MEENLPDIVVGQWLQTVEEGRNLSALIDGHPAMKRF